MKKSEILRALRDEYERALEEKRDERQARIDEVVAKAPEVEALIYAGPGMLLQQARMLLKDPQRAKDGAHALRGWAEAQQKALHEALRNLGYPENYLDMRYDCPLCQDKGYIEDPVRRDCECFQRKLTARLHEASLDPTNGAQTFAAYDERLLPDDEKGPDGRTQRERTALVMARCRRYADEYPHVSKPGLVLTGGTGLGKTFLLNCIDNELAERGFETVRATAFQMFEAMRAYHYGGAERQEAFEEMLTCPMLLIDDLGTEPLMQNITVEYLFTLLNERLVNRRCTVIATNLTPDEIRARYGERVYSRLVDQAHMAVYPLFGRDLRRAR